jgi:complex I intermediate-associated protein 30 (CIA30)
MRRRQLIKLVCGAATALLVVARGNTMDAKLAIIDDLSREPPLSTVGTRWQLFTDQVMGGVSNGSMMREAVAGRLAIRMRGDVSLENKGGFVQIAIDLMPGGKAKDASTGLV